MKLLSHVSILVISFLLSACFHRWTEKQRKDFQKKCLETESARFYVRFTGFAFYQVDTILVEEYVKEMLINNFYIFADKDFFDSNRIEYHANTGRKINIKHTYKFFVEGEDTPYILCDMEMVIWPQYSMTSEGYGCVLGRYKLDDKLFDNANPNITKRDL